MLSKAIVLLHCFELNTAEVNKMHSKLETKIDSISTISKLELDSFRTELESNRRAMEETAKGIGCKSSVTFLFVRSPYDRQC